MDSIDSQDKIQKIIKYGKYIILIGLAIAIFLLIRNCGRSYDDIEDDVIEATKSYISQSGITINGEKYIELTSLKEIEGTELCSKASGVVVTNNNGKLNYDVYLDCLDYKSPLIKNKNKYIVLVGGDVITLNKGEIFQDPMYTLKKESEVVISGKVGTEPGVYTLTYIAYVDSEIKETVYRKVIITNNDKSSNISGLTDTEKPTITLLGDRNMVIALNSNYKEPGYRAVDYIDGKISRKVEYNVKAVDPTKVGIYTITYTVTNSRGNMALAVRTVKVVKQKSDFDIQMSINTTEFSKSVYINFKIIGEGYSYTIMPNGERTAFTNGKYLATANKVYTFKMYDKYGNEYIKEYEVTNIDNVPPVGICKALVRGNNTEVEVTASDNKGISGYQYILDGSTTEKKLENTYSVTTASKTVGVNIIDIAENQTKINCEVTIKSTTTVTSTVNTSEYNLVSTKNDVLAFAQAVANNGVSQDEPPGYGDMCLSFAYYHAYKLYNGDSMSAMSAPQADDYLYAGRFRGVVNDSKEEILAVVYESLNAGQPCILHVNGNKAGNSRHYVTVVGYKSSVTSASSLTEQDLLIIDSYDGKLESMDTESSRFMISGYDTGRTGSNGYGYQVYILR